VDGGAKVQWHCEVKKLGGLLKMVPSGLIRGAAQKVIEDGWKGVAEKITG
jgi:carbon monoxide dehydrogenase subunit G